MEKLPQDTARAHDEAEADGLIKPITDEIRSRIGAAVIRLKIRTA